MMNKDCQSSVTEEKDTEFQTCDFQVMEKESIIEQLRANGFRITR